MNRSRRKVKIISSMPWRRSGTAGSDATRQNQRLQSAATGRSAWRSRLPASSRDVSRRGNATTGMSFEKKEADRKWGLNPWRQGSRLTGLVGFEMGDGAPASVGSATGGVRRSQKPPGIQAVVQSAGADFQSAVSHGFQPALRWTLPARSALDSCRLDTCVTTVCRHI